MLARCPEVTRRRILGLPPLYLAEKTHVIAVDLRTGQRSVWSVAEPPEESVAAGPSAKRPARKARPSRYSFVRIVAAVCAAWGLEPGALQARVRSFRIARPRFAAFRLVHRLLRWPLIRIGRAFQRDHTSIAAGLRRAAELFKRDRDWRRRYQTAQRALKRQGRGGGGG